MSTYLMPEGMRPATLEERKQFYTNEFKVRKVAAWLRDRPSKTNFAVIIGRHTKIFPVEYFEDADTTIIIDKYRDLGDVRRQILEFLPEAAYYDRNIYIDGKKAGQELAFDLDPENVTCPVHGSLADRLARGQGLGFCSIELDIVRKQAMGLYEFLEKEYSCLRVVYSGRGFHIHVFDKEAYLLTTKNRLTIARDVKKKGFAIDEWVTAGEMRLIRLPYSLHGMVSRVVLPLEKTELERFDPVRDKRCIPRFLREKPNSSFS
jgi:DNA primase catalytic subunit